MGRVRVVYYLTLGRKCGRSGFFHLIRSTEEIEGGRERAEDWS